MIHRFVHHVTLLGWKDRANLLVSVVLAIILLVILSPFLSVAALARIVTNGT